MLPLTIFSGCAAAKREAPFNIKNSTFEEVVGAPERTGAWAVIQIRHVSKGKPRGGFRGTAWIVRASNDEVVFAAAWHVIKDTFTPAEKNIVNTEVFLANSEGESIAITKEMIISHPSQDVAFAKVPTSSLKTSNKIHALDIANEEDFASSMTGQSVFNLGFPYRAQKETDNTLEIFQNRPGVRFHKGPWRQSGRILKQFQTSGTLGSDEKFSGRCFLIDYETENGFSGGPLFLVRNSKVVGMMIAVNPNPGGGPPTESLALDIREILPLIDKSTVK